MSMDLASASNLGLQLVNSAAIYIEIKSRIFIADLDNREKINGFRRDYPQCDYPTSAQEWQLIDQCTSECDTTQTYLYIGAIGGPVPHHGHSLLETVSRWWPLWNPEFMSKVDVLVLTWLDIYSAYVAKHNKFIPNINEYVASLPKKGSSATDPSIDWATKLLVASGQGNKPLLVVAETTKFKNFWLPIQTAAMGTIDARGPELTLANHLYQNLAKFWSQDCNHAPEAVTRMNDILKVSTRLWLSRRCILESRLAASNLDKPSCDQQRCCINEPELEILMKEKFNMVAVKMEQFSMQEQIYLVAHCSMLAGLYGSALHSCMFAPPGINVIVLGDQRWPAYMQPAQQNAIKIAHGKDFFLPLVAKSKNGSTWCYEWDLDVVVQQIAQILNKQ
jgi:hypothetical protein